MEKRDWPKIVQDYFNDVHFCWVHEIRVSQAFDDVDKVRVTFGFSGTPYVTERQKKKKIQELIPLCSRLVNQYPRCMFAFCYFGQHDEIVIFLESPLIPEPVKPPEPTEYYRGLPKMPSPRGDLHSRTYDVAMDKLIELSLCSEEQIKTILDHKKLLANSLTYSDLIDFVLDYRVVVKYFKKGEATCLPFFNLPDSFNGAIRLIDKVVFFDLYNATKSKTTYKCYCCGAVGQAIHHINGNHFDMVEENLAFLCNACHFELHPDWLQQIGIESHHRNTHDRLAVT